VVNERDQDSTFNEETRLRWRGADFGMRLGAARFVPHG
jgi:hypothetical protein